MLQSWPGHRSLSSDQATAVLWQRRLVLLPPWENPLGFLADVSSAAGSAAVNPTRRWKVMPVGSVFAVLAEDQPTELSFFR